jgi:dihydroneopterin aldolase
MSVLRPGADRVRGRDTVTLKGMRFHALIGVLAHEAHLPQPLEIDVTLDVVPARGARIVDYTEVYDAVREVVTAGHIEYLEDVAEQTAARLLRIDRVAVVHITVRKPHVALRGPLDYAEIAIVRERDV